MVRKLGFVFVAAALGCSSAGGDTNFPAAGGSGGNNSGNGGSGGLINVSGSGGGSSDIDPPCGQGADGDDKDHDGFTVGEGDCNDCSVHMNPGAYDYSGNGVDEDCNGTADDEPFGCDQGLAIEGDDAADAARSLGLCKFTSEGERTWGVISARYVFPDGSTSSKQPDAWSCEYGGGPQSGPNAASHGLLPSFGSKLKPRDGSTMVSLSSGIARSGVNGESPGGAEMCTKSGTPAGFPTPSSAACPGQSIDDTPVANDGIALELTIRAPTNAKSIAFDFDFYTYEYPGYICTEYNDFFVSLLYSGHSTVPANKNISFDAQHNPVSVNNGFLEACSPGTHGGKKFQCSLGTSELEGTGFDDSAATGWLQTTASILPGEEFKIRFAVWDMGDEVLDSTVLIDNFRFDVNEGENQTVRPPPK